MTHHHAPRIKGIRESALVLAVLAVPLAVTLAVQPHHTTVSDAEALSALVAAPVVLAAAIAAYVHWRISGLRESAWLTVVLVVAALVHTTRATMMLVHTERMLLAGGWGTLLQLLMALTVLSMALTARRRDIRVDPVLAGLLIGTVLALVLATGPLLLGPLSLTVSQEGALTLAVLLVGALNTAAVLCLPYFEPWLRRRLAAAVVLFTLGQSTTSLPGWRGLVETTVVLNSLGAAVLCAAVLALLQEAIGQTRRELASLHEALEEVEAEVRVDRERLHEISSTIAGIASATEVIRDGFGLSVQRRHDLEDMLEAELARLTRLISSRAPLGSRPFWVDEVLEQLVLSQQARGREVFYAPSSHRAVGQPDEFAEVVHILLENAARHGGSGAVMVDVREVGDHLEVVVSDTGPGVPPPMRATLFEWGARGPGSPGQGIGLHIARALMDKNDGTLDLVESSAPGATFVARLPLDRAGREARAHSA